MFKLFSVAEANKLIPQVDEKIREMQASARDLRELQEKLQQKRPQGIQALNNAQEMKFLLTTVQQLGADLNRMGVYIKDLEQGSVDFPSQIGAEVIRLCWEQGDADIRYYRHLNDERKILLPEIIHQA
ncbi:MAG: DUF2203 domain-containing protein [Deinococcales bacterium]